MNKLAAVNVNIVFLFKLRSPYTSKSVGGISIFNKLLQRIVHIDHVLCCSLNVGRLYTQVLEIIRCPVRIELFNHSLINIIVN